MGKQRRRLRDWLTPVVYLSRNLISRAGVVIVTTATVFWLFLLPLSVRGEATHPYIGILAFLVLPTLFFLGLTLIPLGILRYARRERRAGHALSYGPLTLRSPELRQIAVFIGITTLANIIIGSQLSYRAVTYMDGVSFCGQTCHQVMQPEYAAYQNSPHSRIDCVACHIGPGASWFVKSKLSGVGQVFAVVFRTYPRPIPTPVSNLRPARETCEACHWPQKYGADRLRIINNYADDEGNTLKRTVLLMRISGGYGSRGIHGAHLGAGVTIHYSPADQSRQTIPRVEYRNAGQGRRVVYTASDAKPEALRSLPTRLMDCMDCHNRPTHTFQLPERALDTVLTAGDISATLPSIKKTGVALLKKEYKSQAEAAEAIPAALRKFYQAQYPAVYASRRADIDRAAAAIVAIYQRNVFPQMRVTWGTYPNNLGHTDFPGCFRCHDGSHAASDSSAIASDCNTCHQLLASDEPSPKILTELGLVSGTGSQ